MKISRTWDFGNDKEIADELKDLVLKGTKKATTGLYQSEQEHPRSVITK